MKIWITRHGQTRFNRSRLMQGLTDEPLNEKGIEQAERAREVIGDVRFDAVYSSPLIRAKQTASIIGGVGIEEVITDPRIIEADFGKYELHKYYLLGPAMTLYWALPEVFPAPKTVETTASLRRRSVTMFSSHATEASCGRSAGIWRTERAGLCGDRSPITVRSGSSSLRAGNTGHWNPSGSDRQYYPSRPARLFCGKYLIALHAV